MSSYAEQDEFFALAYRTGTDHWTKIPFRYGAQEIASHLHKGSMVLDIGAGRGAFLLELSKLGFRAIGVENNPELIKSGNEEIGNKGLQKDLRFVEGSCLDIPLADHSFDAVVDFCVMQHMRPEDYSKYISEVLRVLKQGGYFFLTTLSKDTKKYFTWIPDSATIADYELEGIHYHFASDQELQNMFGRDFEIKKLAHDKPYLHDEAVFAFLVLQKK